MMKYFLYLKLFFNYFTPVVNFFKNAKDHPKSVIAVLVLAATLFGGWEVKQVFDKQKAETALVVSQRDFLIKEKAQLQLDLAAAVKANQEDQVVIGKLSEAKADYQQGLKELANAQKTNKSQIDSIRNSIQAAPSSEDGPVAKVLADTIRTIQSERGAQ